MLNEKRMRKKILDEVLEDKFQFLRKISKQGIESSEIEGKNYFQRDILACDEILKILKMLKEIE